MAGEFTLPPDTMDIRQLVSKFRSFRDHLARVKEENPPADFTWYGFDILSNVLHIDRTLTGKNRELFGAIGNGPILDIGAADGDLAFFLESEGFDVEIIDLPVSNWNGLRGAYRLRELLGSKVPIHEKNVDAPLDLPRHYRLVLFLGILYHLRNPYQALEGLVGATDYLLLSTRVARLDPTRKTDIDGISVAYLLDPDECYNDASNFWIFSRTALRKLVRRTGWEILDETSVGETRSSDPVSTDHDERVFMLLRSTRAA